jgi:hypothetical protein
VSKYDNTWMGGEFTRDELALRPDFTPDAERKDVAAHLAKSPTCTGRFKLITGDGPRDRCRCADCGAFIYCVPKSETGKPVRRVVTRDKFKPGTRERILQRSGAICAVCETKDPGIGGWHVSHIISVNDCKSYGFDSDDYNQDDNLCICCERCNLGVGEQSLIVPTMIRLVLMHNRHRRGRSQP